MLIGSRAPVGSRALYRSRRSRTHSHSCSRCNPDSRTRRSRGSCNRSNRHRTPGARSTPHHCSTLGTRSPRPCSTERTRGSRQCSCRSRCSSWWICPAAPSLRNLRKPERREPVHLQVDKPAGEKAALEAPFTAIALQLVTWRPPFPPVACLFPAAAAVGLAAE